MFTPIFRLITLVLIYRWTTTMVVRPLTIRQPRMTVKRAESVIGGALGNAGKMPCRTYGLPAAECQVGSKLREEHGTVCAGDPARGIAGCYAYKRGQYIGGTVVAQYRRLDTIASPEWIEAMVYLIGRQSPLFFRWHDSGDVQSVEHLNAICEVARRLPDTKFWLPTQERGYVRQWRKLYGAIPVNLCIRISATKLGMFTGTYHNDPELTSSMVVVEGNAPEGTWSCPSRLQDNKCGDCRACWSRNVKTVAYHHH